MTVARAVLRGRRLAERLMTSTCVITRRPVPNARTYDHTTMTYTDPDTTVVYDGKCRVKANARLDHIVDAGEQPVTLYRFVLSLPISAPQVEVDDVVTINGSALDPALPGLVLRVREPEWGDQITARRASVEVHS